MLCICMCTYININIYIYIYIYASAAGEGLHDGEEPSGAAPAVARGEVGLVQKSSHTGSG